MLRDPQFAQKHDVSTPIMENPDAQKPWSERSDTTRVILRRLSSNRDRPSILNRSPQDSASTSTDSICSTSAPETSTLDRNRSTRHSLLIRNKNKISRFIFETDFNSSGKCGVCSKLDLDTAFSPCRHIYACHDCANNIMRTSGVCPVCKHTITAVDRC
ncbi:unnamed protein product [Cylicocyclus nassatus]|uniref:RING-type domain-containing protein n=1 Tax=Cylicocyclus nassatus TaxID=53992 RepID=A0AA36HFB5_CYLNA|nr:unnamed protein product [Cylicocyclus nassatus]